MNKKERKLIKYFENSVESTGDFSKIENKINIESKKANKRFSFKILTIACSVAVCVVCVITIVIPNLTKKNGNDFVPVISQSSFEEAITTNVPTQNEGVVLEDKIIYNGKTYELIPYTDDNVIELTNLVFENDKYQIYEIEKQEILILIYKNNGECFILK